MLLAELEEACLDLAEQDVAGQNWSETHLYHGYTSYASLNDLPQRDPRIGDLVCHLNRHVAAFAKDCAFDLGGKRLKLDSLWITVLAPGVTHSGHIPQHSVVSGTIYLALPPGSGSTHRHNLRPAMLVDPTGP